ncbi:MAG: hypothetical protein ACXABO_10155 [Promethearchaeota archaeon]|jgi:GTPase SAR1 family protein
MSTDTESVLGLKISILGDEGIGKDKFINLFTSDQFKKESESGESVVSYKGNLKLDTETGKQEYVIRIWDLKEKTRIKNSHSHYLKESHGILIFFNLTNRRSFDKIPNWIDNIRNGVNLDIPILLVGNRKKSKNFVVSPTEINSIIRKFNLYYLETSLTTREGVFDSFYCITSLSLGIDVNHDFFLTKDIVYYPTQHPVIINPISQKLTSQDISNLGQKAIFDKIELLEEKIKKSMEIEIPSKLVLIEITISIVSLILYIIQDSLYRLDTNNPLRAKLVDPILFIAIGGQITFVALIIVFYIKRYSL